MSAQIERVDVIVLAQGASHPIPGASVVEPTVDQHDGRLAFLSVIPKLQLQTIRIEEMRNRFQTRGLIRSVTPPWG